MSELSARRAIEVQRARGTTHLWSRVTVAVAIVAAVTAVVSGAVAPSAFAKSAPPSVASVEWTGNGTSVVGVDRVLNTEICDANRTPSLIWVLAGSKATSATITIGSIVQSMGTPTVDRKTGLSNFKYRWTADARIDLAALLSSKVTVTYNDAKNKATLTVGSGCQGPTARDALTFVYDTTLLSSPAIELVLTGPVDATIDWGDATANGGCATVIKAASGEIVRPACTYGSSSTYTVRLTGAVSNIGADPAFTPAPSSSAALVQVTSFGAVGVTGLAGAFASTPNLSVVPASLPGTVTDMTRTFFFSGFNGSLAGWNVTGVTKMSGAFQGAGAFNRDLSGWNVANVTSTASMFAGATAFNQNIGAWDVAKVTTMESMFYGATAFNQNIGAWNVASLTNTAYMFYGATAFNQNIGAWNVANVTSMVNMFAGATAFDQDIGAWNVTNVTASYGMFSGATAFNQDIGGWNVANNTSMDGMFAGASAFNQNIGAWNVANVTSMFNMFGGAAAFNQNIGAWNVSSVTDMRYMFQGATTFNQNLGGWSVANVTAMTNMFYGATAFDQDLSGWCVTNIATAPSDFATDATSWTLAQPTWGTCPTV